MMFGIRHGVTAWLAVVAALWVYYLLAAHFEPALLR